MIESDHSYIFAEIDEGETTWKLLSRIPDEIIRQIDYLAWEEEGIATPMINANPRYNKNE